MSLSTIRALRPAHEIHVEGDPGYDDARRTSNAAANLQPAAVAVPTTTEQVQELVLAAGQDGVRIVPLSTGHGAGALEPSEVEGALLIRLSAMDAVSIEGGSARVGAGATWGDVIAATAPQGFTALHGSSPDVGVVGFALGGGLSFYARQHGLAVNAVRECTVVTADGRLVRASADENPQLFWALRGGGSNLGIVVELVMDLLPITHVVGGMMIWDRDRALEVLRVWSAWCDDAPNSATTTCRVMSFPPLPELPPFLSGRDVVVIDGVVLGDDADAVLTPLRELGPEVDTFGPIPAAEVLGIHMDPPEPIPFVGAHCVLDELGPEPIDALMDVVGPGTNSGLMFTELRHLGGALAHAPAGSGALAAVAGRYALFCLAVAPSSEAAVAGQAAAESVIRAVERWSSERVLPTFAESQVDPARFFGKEGTERLREVRDALDSGRLLVSRHPV